MRRVLVRKDTYYDSVFLMLLSKEVKGTAGVGEAVISLGTETNLALVRDMGLWDESLAAATPNDLIIAVEAESEAAVDAAVAAAERLISKKTVSPGAGGETYLPASLEAAIRVMPEANLAVISLPGAFAPREARKALDRGLHVMLFSDNVTLEEEISLKRRAREKGLLMMGPDCGTAIINGKPLCFANVVRRGNIGLVAASGTGLQEVTCCIHKFGGGVSQAIGTGGRDLKNERVGGSTMLMGIEALKNDPSTKVIVVISKPPAPETAARVIEALENTGKAGVVHFIGMKGAETEKSPALGFDREAGGRPGFLPEVFYATNLEETAGMASALSRGELYRPRTFTAPPEEIEKIVERETSRMGRAQKYLRGLYTGGTLADEAMLLFHDKTEGVYSNNQTDPAFLLKDPFKSIRHTVVDLGDDVFTLGRPHPMIDPTVRNERLLQEADDPETALLLLDVVLGYGSHPDPAGEILPALSAARAKAAARGGRLSVVASVTGTEADPQNLEAQKRKLEEAGCVVMPSNYQAVMLGVKIMEKTVSP